MRKHFIVVDNNSKAVPGSDKKPRRYNNQKRAGRVAGRLARKALGKEIAVYAFVGYCKSTKGSDIFVTPKGRKRFARK